MWASGLGSEARGEQQEWMGGHTPHTQVLREPRAVCTSLPAEC